MLATSPILLWLATGLLLGDALPGLACRLPFPLLVTVTIAALGCLLCGPLGRRLGGLLLAAAYGIVAAAEIYEPRLGVQHLALLAGRRPIEIEAVVVADAGGGGRWARLLLEASQADSGNGWQAAEGLVRLTLRRAQKHWLAGDRIRLRTSLRRPRNFGNPGEFDFSGYLARRGIYVTAYADDDRNFRLLSRPTPTVGLISWRRQIGALFDDNAAPEDAAVLRALIIGDDASIPMPLRRAFSRAGVTHVLSISGLHVGLVATVGVATFRWLLARSRWLLLTLNVPKLAVAMSVAPVLLYAGIAGSNVATLRSVIMIVVFLGAVLVDRQRHLLASLAAAAILTLVSNPGSALDISFQLSFVAVLGLTLAMQVFWPWWRRREEVGLLRLRSGWRTRVARPIAVYVAVSISALAATTPLTALHFNQVSLTAPVSNAIVVPLLGSLAVVLGLGAALLAPLIPAAAAVTAVVAGYVVHVGCWLTEWCARLPGAALRVVTPTRCELVLIYAALLTAVLADGPRRRRLLIALSACAIVDAGWWWRERYAHDDLRLTSLSVGQGDGALVELPGGKVMLVDGAGIGDGSFDVGERIIAPFLWSRKIARVDYIVLSHPQWDHYGGLQFVVEQFSPRELWWNGTASDARHFVALMKSVAAQNVLPVKVRRGYERTIDGLELKVLSPPADAVGWSINDLSVVLQATFASHRILFTGDIEAPAESYLLANAGDQLRSDVLKVPHHGSRTSSTPGFVKKVSPQLAILSLGFENRFRFPSLEVLGRYHAAGSQVSRTDLDGAVTARLSPLDPPVP